MSYFWYGKFEVLTTSQSLLQPKPTNIFAIVKNNVFVAKICEYALYESSEGLFCARRKTVNPCHTICRNTARWLATSTLPWTRWLEGLPKEGSLKATWGQLDPDGFGRLYQGGTCVCSIKYTLLCFEKLWWQYMNRSVRNFPVQTFFNNVLYFVNKNIFNFVMVMLMVRTTKMVMILVRQCETESL